jgi:hypothetical protein
MCRFWALSSTFPLFASSDHLPLKWIRKCEKGPVSEFTIEQLSDIQWIHSYIPGPKNCLFDALSRYPLLGPRVLAPVGLSDAVSQLLDSLPDFFLKDARLTCMFAPPHTQKVAQQIQAWRRLTNPIDIHSLTHRTAPSPEGTGPSHCRPSCRRRPPHCSPPSNHHHRLRRSPTFGPGPMHRRRKPIRRPAGSQRYL